MGHNQFLQAGAKFYELCLPPVASISALKYSKSVAPNEGGHGSMSQQSASRPRASQACTALSHINLGMPEPDAAHPNRCLPDCCFLEAGIVALALPTDFNRIGSTACASRQQLQTVDLSQTEDHGVRSLPQVYLSTGGFHPTIPALHGAMRLCRLHAISSNMQTRKK